MVYLFFCSWGSALTSLAKVFPSGHANCDPQILCSRGITKHQQFRLSHEISRSDRRVFLQGKAERQSGPSRRNCIRIRTLRTLPVYMYVKSCTGGTSYRARILGFILPPTFLQPTNEYSCSKLVGPFFRSQLRPWRNLVCIMSNWARSSSVCF